MLRPPFTDNSQLLSVNNTTENLKRLQNKIRFYLSIKLYHKILCISTETARKMINFYGGRFFSKHILNFIMNNGQLSQADLFIKKHLENFGDLSFFHLEKND